MKQILYILVGFWRHKIYIGAIISKTSVTDAVFAEKTIPRMRFLQVLTLWTCFPCMFECWNFVEIVFGHFGSSVTDVFWNYCPIIFLEMDSATFFEMAWNFQKFMPGDRKVFIVMHLLQEHHSCDNKLCFECLHFSMWIH